MTIFPMMQLFNNGKYKKAKDFTLKLLEVNGQYLDPTFKIEKQQYQQLQKVFNDCLNKNMKTHETTSNFIKQQQNNFRYE